MTGSKYHVAGVALWLTACSDPDDGSMPAGVPPEFPQLGPIETGRAELVVDGEPVVAGNGFGTIAGVGLEHLAGRLNFGYVLTISVADLEPGEYSAQDGDLEASWNEIELPTYSLDDDCGRGKLYVDGSSVHGYLALPTVWGTMQLELCEEGEPAFEVSGRFTVIVPTT